MKTCSHCGTRFDPADRASPGALEGAIVQIEYCSGKCKKAAANKRYYARNAELVKSRVIANRRKKKVSSRQ